MNIGWGPHKVHPKLDMKGRKFTVSQLAHDQFRECKTSAPT